MLSIESSGLSSKVTAHGPRQERKQISGTKRKRLLIIVGIRTKPRKERKEARQDMVGEV